MPRPQPAERGLQTLLAAIENAYHLGPVGVLDTIRSVLHDRDEHLLTVDEGGTWSLEHTLDCRIAPGLDQCPFNAWATDEAPIDEGRYLVKMLAPIAPDVPPTFSVMALMGTSHAPTPPATTPSTSTT